MKKFYNWMLPLGIFLWLAHGALAQDPIARYSFSGNANDLSGNGHHAAIHAANLTTDRFGAANSAIAFDGVQSKLTVPNSIDLQTESITISFWVRPSSIPGSGEVFLMSHGGWQERWKISVPNHGKPVWTTNSTGGISDLDSGDGNVLFPNQWNHVVFVHDGTKDRIYFNGVKTAEKDAVGALNATQYPLGIGYNPIDNANFFHGSIDDISIYDYAATDVQIADIYELESDAPTIPNGPVATYPFSGNFNDSSYGNTANGKFVSFVPDRFGVGQSAVKFNGSSSELVADNSSTLISPWTTVAFWINPSELPANGEAYIASFGGWQNRWKISLPPHGKLVWTVNAVQGISDLDAGDAGILQTNTWTHVAVVHGLSEDLIYINGVLVASKLAGGALNSTTEPLGIGFDPIDGGSYFNGAIDEFTIFNEALNATNINSLYLAQAGGGLPTVDKVLDLDFAGDAQDETQYKNHGNVKFASLGYDRFGYANNAMTIKNNDEVTVPNSVQYNSPYTTVSFWVNLNSIPATGEVFLLSHGGWQERWKISLPSHGKPVWTTNNSGGISDMDSGDGNALVAGTWTHVVMSHGPDSDKIYINGELANEKAVGGEMNSTKYDLGIGFNPIDGANFIDGSIDEVQLYNRELTAIEVSLLYDDQSTAPAINSELVAQYTFAGNGNDQTRFRNNADVAGAQLSVDRFGRNNHSMNFGTGTEVTADNSVQLNSEFTSVSFWVNPNTIPANGEAFLLSHGGWQERWKISLPTHGKPVWTTNHSGGISDMDSGGGNELIPGEWTHVVMVHDGTKDYIYFNGEEVANKDVVGTLNATTHPLGIGYNPIDGGNYFDGNIDDVEIYNFALSAEDVADLYALQSQSPVITDTEPPVAPVNLAASVSFTTVYLTWNASTDSGSGLSGYNVYQDGNIIGTTTSTDFTVEDLAPLTFYDFGVSAVDNAGNASVTNSITVQTDMDQAPDITPPTVPTGLSVTPGATSAVFSWEASTDDTGVAGYVVFVDGVYQDTTDGDATGLFIGGLDPSTLYTFEVYAFDFAGNDSEIAFITASTTEPIETGEPGLVAHYKFENNTNDSTPYNNHGVAGGDPVYEVVTNRPNASGMAIKFDGDQDSVLVPNAVQLISDYTTVSFWIRVDGQNLSDAEAYLMSFGSWQERWKISLPQHLKVVWTTNGNNAQFDEFISDMDSGDGNELTLGFWWYVTMVHDGTDDIIYLDGQEVNRKPVNTKLNSTALPFGIGNNPIEGGQYFNGAMDEIKIYNKSLTAEEIQSLYENGTTTGTFDPQEVHKYVQLVYPNPTANELRVDHSFAQGAQLMVRLFDLQGRQVGHQKLNEQTNINGQIILNVSHLQPGMYQANFVMDGKNLGSLPFIKN